MKRQSAQPKFFVILAAFILSMAIIACACDFTDLPNPVANLCAGFDIAAATGFPFGPLDISIAKLPHGNPPQGYQYYYEIDVQALMKDNPPIDLASKVMEEPKSSKPNFSLTLPLNQATAELARAVGGHYIVEAFVYLSFGPNPKDFFLECVKSKEIKLAPKQKKAPAATVTPTNPPPPPPQGQPPQQPPANPPQQPTDPPQPTPCPPGYQGDPAHGQPCLPIPR